MKLYELSTQYNKLLDLAEHIDEKVFIDTLASIEDLLEEKVVSVAKMIKSIESDTNTIKEEEKRLADRRKALENKVSGIKEYLQQQLEFAGIDKVKRPTLTVSIQANPPSVEIADESLIPIEYMIPQPAKINKKEILAVLKEGYSVLGCSIKQGKGLRIK